MFTICFLTLAALKWRIALWFLFLLLPSYLVRFSIFGIPSNVLEVMLLTLVGTWIFKERNNHKQHLETIKNLYTEHRSIFFASGIFLLAATVSIFTAVELRQALGEWKAFYLEPIIFSLILLLEFYQDKNKTSIYILTPLLLLACTTSLLAIYQHVTGWMVPWDFWENRNTFRVTGWYGFPNAVGLFLAPIFPLSLFLLITTTKNKKISTKSLFTHYYLLITSALTLITIPIAIVFAKSTGALIGLLAGIGILTLIWKKTRWFAVAAGIIGLIGLVLVPSTNPIKQELLAQDRSGQIRIQMWAETVELLRDKPIAGAGLASYKTVVWPYRFDKWIEVFHHPHNIILTMWVNLGILGLIGFLWICVWFIRVCLMQIHKGNLQVIPYLLAAMITWLMMGLVDSPYIKNDWSIFFWILIILLVLEANSQTKKEG